MQIRYYFSILLFGLLIAAPKLGATVVSGQITGGNSLKMGAKFIKLQVPFSQSRPANTVGQDTFTQAHLYAFDEDQNITLAKELKVNIAPNSKSRTKNRIAAGTVVASHYVFFDPAKSLSQKAKVTFDAKVLGVMTQMKTLRESDILANTSVKYLNPEDRGLEVTDRVKIIDEYTVQVDWKANSPGDFIRVITEYSPGATFLVPD